jgi:hypothetical protein
LAVSIFKNLKDLGILRIKTHPLPERIKTQSQESASGTENWKMDGPAQEILAVTTLGIFETFDELRAIFFGFFFTILLQSPFARSIFYNVHW